MSDKEPRRRKKRKDSQSRKDDIRSEDHLFLSSKSDSKDSDQEGEEEVIVPSHQPSTFARFVFMVVFSVLIVSMSFIFISLRGADRGELDIIDDHHIEEPEVPLDVHSEVEEAEPPFEENLEDLLPGIGSLLSFNNDDESKADDDELAAEDDDSTDVHITENEAVRAQTYEESSRIAYDDEDVIEEIEEFNLPPEVTSEATQHQTPESPSQEPEPVKEEPETPGEEETVIEQSVYTALEKEPEPQDAIPNTSAVDEDNVIESHTEEEDLNGSHHPSDVDEEEDVVYQKSSITNEEDFLIRDQLDELDDILERFPDKALKRSEELLQLHPDSPRVHYAKAKALDKLAETQRSNKLLEEAIAVYQKVMKIKNVPEELYLSAGTRASERARFRGYMGKSLVILSEMMDEFPRNIDVKNQVAVGYMFIGRNDEAKNVLREVLLLAPDSGFAKVHLGFILKTDDSNYVEAVRLLQEGIASREEGVKNGRFYYHLGDALYRIGKAEEAKRVHEEGAKTGLFLSPDQRSLYNVDGLTGKPWWDPEKSVYAPDFRILERNWLTIRNEALSLMDKDHASFQMESEGLRDTGDWKQFELFMRGRKKEENCLKAPKTCALISQIPNAAGCRRGQVKFSVMHPSTHVWPHTGPTNARLRAHLGLKIPDGVSIRVVNETRVWKEGKVLLFDDSFEHEVWHNGTEPRLVLIIDFWHPELSVHQRKTLTPI